MTQDLRKTSCISFIGVMVLKMLGRTSCLKSTFVKPTVTKIIN